jgi:hypothetical protein
MRNLLAFLAAVLLIFAVLGWFRGWYVVEKTPASPGHSAVKVDIDSGKIGEDLHEGGEKLQEALDKNHKDASTKRPDSAKTDPTKPAATH